MMRGFKNGVFLAFAAGMLFRLFFWGGGMLRLPVGSDEAILGLMARQVFSGEFPLMIWVQPHGGALETYLTAPLYLLFRGGKLTVRLFPLAYSAVFMVLLYLTGRDFFGRTAGLMTAAISAVPPVYLSMLGALGISMNLPAFAGSAFIVYASHRASRLPPDDGRRLRLMMVTGLAAGLAFWVHLIVACAAAAAVLFFFLEDKFFFLRKHFLGFASCFVLGALPLIVFNLNTDFSTFRMSPARDIAGTLEYLRTGLSYTLPRTWGFEAPVYIDNPYFLPLNRFFAVSYALLALGLAVFGAAKRLKGSRFFFRRGRHKPDGAWILLAVSVICVAVFARSSRSNAHSMRYLIYTFIGGLPLIGFALAEIFRRNRALSVVLAGFLLAFHLYGSAVLARAWADPVFVERKINIPENKNLIGFLLREGLTRGYMHYWLSYPVVFRSDGDILASPAYDERFGRYRHPYLDAVESAEDVFYAFHPASGLSADWFRGRIAAAGGAYSESAVDNFTVFHGFKPPFEGALRAVCPSGLVFSASHNPDLLPALADGDDNTRWGSASPQSPGMYVLAETAGAPEIAGVEMRFGRWGHDHPRGVRVLISRDAEKWTEVFAVSEIAGSVYWDGLRNPRIFTGRDSYRMIFDPLPARFVKIVQTGSHPVFDWSLAGLEILEAEH